jgi:heme o synthase
MTSPTISVSRASRVSFADWLALVKPRITTMVVFTALVGFVTASPGPPWTALLAAALAGTGLVAAGASVLNQVLERDTDALMLRTRSRPLPSGHVRPVEAVVFGALLTATGLATLLWRSGLLATAVAFLTWASYLFAYTPLKRRTPLATLVGAVPGALPPVIGWAAASGRLDAGALILFAIMFLWQVPHFLAIAWLYRDDYARAGFPMLPVIDRDGRFTARQAVLHSLALLPVSLAPFAAGLAGPAYVAGALLLGLALTFFAVRLARARDIVAARGLFLASLVYLPALSSLLLAARR